MKPESAFSHSRPEQPHATAQAKVSLSKVSALELAFRPGFLLASLLSMLSLAIWLGYLHGVIHLPYGMLSATVWHLHEMLFGFAATVAVAFILTAVQTWTGLRSLHGLWLLIWVVLWISVRFLLWGSSPLEKTILLIAQSSWWLISIVTLARLLLRAQNKRNLIFVPLLTVMMLLNLGILISDYLYRSDWATHLGRTTILLFGLLVSLLGGRVIPFFTQRGAANAKVIATPRLDKCLPLITPSAIAIYFSRLWLSLANLESVLFFVIGTMHLLRLWHWSSRTTLAVPLLWSLHLTYAMLGIGLITLGISGWLVQIRQADAMHLVAVGTIGGMILAMMCRVSLGHTGRPLATPAYINLAFMAMVLAALIRFGLPTFGLPHLGWSISGALWLMAFSGFLYRYFPILIRPRYSGASD